MVHRSRAACSWMRPLCQSSSSILPIAIRRWIGMIWDRYWPMVRRAAAFLLRHGPVTEEDRWERDGGYATFTLAAGIAALLAAAEHAELQGEPALAESLREEADYRNHQIEDWLYVKGTAIARRCGVEGLLRAHRPGRGRSSSRTALRNGPRDEPTSGPGSLSRQSSGQPRRISSGAFRIAGGG